MLNTSINIIDLLEIIYLFTIIGYFFLIIIIQFRVLIYNN